MFEETINQEGQTVPSSFDQDIETPFLVFAAAMGISFCAEYVVRGGLRSIVPPSPTLIGKVARFVGISSIAGLAGKQVYDNTINNYKETVKGTALAVEIMTSSFDVTPSSVPGFDYLLAGFNTKKES